MATQEDHTKLGNTIIGMARATGHVPSAEDCSKMHSALDMCLAQMKNEDPNGEIYCNQGCLHLNRDVDVWGTCPDMG